MESRFFDLKSRLDGINLACRSHFSVRTTTNTPPVGAVIGHPYASLGGTQDDRVVKFVTQALVDRGIHVVTFDFRGAGGSGGRTSWTGKPEVEDYFTVVQFLVWHLLRMTATQSATDSQPHVRTQRGRETFQSELPGPTIEIVLAGYSYGSMIASSRLLYRHLLEITRSKTPDSDSARADKAKASSSYNPRPYSADRPADVLYGQEAELEGIGEDINLNFSYLLISPLLPPISSLLALDFRWPSQRDSVSYARESGRFVEFPTFVVYGTQDVFTPVDKMRKWCNDVEHKDLRSSPTFSNTEVQGASHFWRTDAELEALSGSIECWLRKRKLGKDSST